MCCKIVVYKAHCILGHSGTSCLNSCENLCSGFGILVSIAHSKNNQAITVCLMPSEFMLEICFANAVITFLIAVCIVQSGLETPKPL